MPKQRKKTRQNLIGEIFLYWTVIAEAGQDKFGHAQWLCKCKCGVEKIVQADHLRRGKSGSCGCLKMEKIRKYSSQEASAREVWRQSYKELSFDEFYILSQQNCHYCNSPPINKFNTWIKKKKYNVDQISLENNIKNGYFTYNGLDRIDSSKGHILNNVVPCCKWCNYAKRERSYQDFINWIHNLHNNIIRIENANRK